MLKVDIVKPPILTHKRDCLLVFIPRNKKKFSKIVEAVDEGLGGMIAEVCQRGDFTGKAGETLFLYCKKFAYQKILLVGIGENEEDIRCGMDAAFALVAQNNIKSALAVLAEMSVNVATYAIIAAGKESYTFHLGKYRATTASLKQLSILPPDDFSRVDLKYALATAEGVKFTRHLAEQPGNICTPQFLASTAKDLGKQHSIAVKVLNEKEMQRLKMGSLLAVAKGSKEPPKLITMSYTGNSKAKKGMQPLVLVGKGVTFDTGGISIKPSAAMDEMKFDMCGAATVYGIMLALSLAKLPINVIGIVPSVENMPDGGAVKPGDVITSMSGKTIEVLNTDAEGRLILCDALTYAEKNYKPKQIIDIATLTGACVVALGHHTTGLMGHNDEFMSALEHAGESAGDVCWQLPLGKKYQEQLKSDYADIANIGGRYAGTITAACFLSRFVESSCWAHLDIAGTAWTTKKRATGRPVPLLMRYIYNQAYNQSS